MSDPPRARKPFEQLPFDALPALPRIPHPYGEAEAADVVVQSRPFGPIRIRVVSYGARDAPPLLLVHGLMTSSYSWRYVLAPLGARFRLVVPDLPGCGASAHRLRSAPTGSALATFIGELQDALGIDGCAAVGNSLGGYLCLRRALEQPASFSRLVVVHAPGLPERRLLALHVALRVPLVAAGLARVVRHDPLRWAHRNVHYYDETLKSLEEARAYGEPLARPDGARAFVRYLAHSLHPRELRGFERDLRERRDGGAGAPLALSLVYAREDPTVPPRLGSRLHALLPDAELHWLERSSHFAQVDSPDRFVALVEDFLAA